MGPDIPGDRADLAGEAFRRMQTITRRVRRAARPELEPLGLTMGQVRALHELARLTGPDLQGAGARMGALAAALDVVPRSATDVVAALEERGLVMRAPDPADGRATVVRLTARGATLLTEVAQRRRAAAVEALGGLNEHELRQLTTLLDRALDDPSAGST